MYHQRSLDVCRIGHVLPNGYSCMIWGKRQYESLYGSLQSLYMELIRSDIYL